MRLLRPVTDDRACLGPQAAGVALLLACSVAVLCPLGKSTVVQAGYGHEAGSMQEVHN